MFSEKKQLSELLMASCLTGSLFKTILTNWLDTEKKLIKSVFVSGAFLYQAQDTILRGKAACRRVTSLAKQRFLSGCCLYKCFVLASSKLPANEGGSAWPFVLIVSLFLFPFPAETPP